MRYIVDGRGSGRTTALAHWLLGGHPVKTWPSWSRVLVVSNDRMADWTVRHNEMVHRALLDLGCPAGLSKVVVPIGSLQRGNGRGRLWRDVEVALDDVDIYGLYGLEVPRDQVVLATVTGSTTTVAQVIDEAHEALRDQVAARPYLAAAGPIRDAAAKLADADRSTRWMV